MKPAEIKSKYPTKKAFIEFCHEYRAPSIKSLGDMIGVSYSSINKLIVDYGVTKSDYAELLKRELSLEEAKNQISKYIEMSKCNVNTFNFYGVKFYVVNEFVSNMPTIFRSKSGVVKKISETDEGDFYFYLKDGTRKVIAKHRFMYCFYNGLKVPPKGDIKRNGEWHEKHGLELANTTSGVSDKDLRVFARKALKLRKAGLTSRKEYLSYIDAFFDHIEKGA